MIQRYGDGDMYCYFFFIVIIRKKIVETLLYSMVQ